MFFLRNVRALCEILGIRLLGLKPEGGRSEEGLLQRVGRRRRCRVCLFLFFLVRLRMFCLLSRILRFVLRFLGFGIFLA